MPDETRKHWTDDEDLLARFVLGQLDARETSSLEQHLVECARCADAVRAERLIAAGLKRAGREDLKQRLSHRISQHRSYEFNWYQAAGIAAAIVLLVTVGIRYDWFIGSVDKQVEHLQKSDSVALAKQGTPAPQVASARPSTDAAKKETSVEVARSMTNAGAGGKKKGSDEKRVLSLEEEKRAVSVPMMLGKGVPGQADKMQPALMAVAADVEELWTQGTVIHTIAVNRFADKVADVAAEAKNLSLVARTKVHGADSAAVRVTQRSASMLPVGQQRAKRSGEVQTLFRQGPQGLQIVLFSDTLLTPQELQQARLEPIGVDSVIVVAGRKLIGYKVPHGWLRRQAK